MFPEQVEESNYSSPESHLYHSVINNEEETVKALLNRGINIHAKVKGPLTSIHVAVVKGHVNIIKHLLLNGADVNSRYPVAENKYTGSTLLYRAAAKGYEAVVSLLLEYSADVKAGNRDKLTALHIAAEKGYLNIVKMLLQRGANVNFTNEDCDEDFYQEQFFENKILRDELNLDVVDVSNISRYEGMYSPLHLAVKGRHENILNLLFESGADVDAYDSHGDTALSLAVQTECLTIVENILNHSPKLNVIGNKLSLSYATKFQGGQLQIIVQKLLQYGFSYDSDLIDEDESVDERALENGYFEIIYKLFADFGEDAEKKNWAKNLLRKAITEGNEDMCRYLLEQGATLDNSFCISSLIGYGLKNLNSSLLNFLIANGLNVQNDHKSLFYAVENRMYDLIKILLKSKAKVNKTKKDAFFLRNYSCYLPFGSKEFPKSNSAISLLLLAAALGDQVSVKLLLEKGANIDFKTDNGLTPLLMSAIGGHLEVVEILLKYHADIESTDFDKRTPLYLAAEFGHENVVKFLLRCGAKIDSRAAASSWRSDLTPFFVSAKNGHLNVVKAFVEFDTRNNIVHSIYDERSQRTALNFASENGHSSVVKFLLERGSKVNQMNDDGETALFDAALNGHAETVQILLEYGANPRFSNMYDKNTPLYDAVKKDREEVVKLLLQYGASPNVACVYRFHSPLTVAAVKGNFNIADMLIKFGADINYFNAAGETALFCSFKNGQSEISKLLLANGAKFSSDNQCNQTLGICAKNGYFDCMQVLLNYCSDVNYIDVDGQTPLLLVAKCRQILQNDSDRDIDFVENHKKAPLTSAADKNRLDIVKILLEKGVNFEFENDLGETALYFAAENGNDALLRLLLEHGANINHVTKDGKTPLIISAERGNFETVKILVKKDANVNSFDSNRQTALYFAAEYGRVDMVKLLLEHEADVDTAAENGKTPFIISSERGHLKCVKEFLKKNVNIHTTDKKGLTALHYAAESGHEEVVKLLLEYCAVIDCESRDDVSLLANCALKGFLKIADTSMKFGAKFDLTAKPDVVDRLAIQLHKWDIKVFTHALEYFSADYKFLNETCLRSLFDAINRLDAVDYIMNDKATTNYENIAKTLVEFSIKMKPVNVRNNDENLVAVRYSDEIIIKNFENECKAELQNMMCETISDSNVLLYDILMGDLNRLASITRNDCFIKFLRSSDFKSKYPLYGNIICHQFNKGQIRRQLIDECVDVCQRSLARFAPLPANIVESILLYLSNTDLRSLKVSIYHSCSGQ